MNVGDLIALEDKIGLIVLIGDRDTTVLWNGDEDVSYYANQWLSWALYKRIVVLL